MKHINGTPKKMRASQIRPDRIAVVQKSQPAKVVVRNGATEDEESLLRLIEACVNELPPTHHVTIDDSGGRAMLSLYREESSDCRVRVGSITAGKRIRR